MVFVKVITKLSIVIVIKGLPFTSEDRKLEMLAYAFAVCNLILLVDALSSVNVVVVLITDQYVLYPTRVPPRVRDRLMVQHKLQHRDSGRPVMLNRVQHKECPLVQLQQQWFLGV